MEDDDVLEVDSGNDDDFEGSESENISFIEILGLLIICFVVWLYLLTAT